ncbi:cellulose 1,4-beta-cellobiosidase precursor [Mycena rosella]|uniref:Glucanase n=1 Tax=Mycena rosella TaxID=1033263 RepID=A0AAD7CYQ9_MYCRO|nr:cellulose 1,4-beta-cellobiosidase precursor [Mycena rosella]
MRSDLGSPRHRPGDRHVPLVCLCTHLHLANVARGDVSDYCSHLFLFVSRFLWPASRTQLTKTHPVLTSQTCTAGGTCTTAQTSVVLDSNWRWTHQTTSTTNCYTGNTWNAALSNCAIDGADYAGTYGITTSGDALTIKFVTGANIGSRVYLMADDSNYKLFSLLNQEFTFTVDMSHLGCGLNGALYFTEMDADGGLAKFPTNKAGAKYGTSYCDAQGQFFLGEKHLLNCIPGQRSQLDCVPTDINSGTGMFGTCCNEMDIWEANLNAAAFTPHTCSVVGQTQCSGIDCGDGDQRYDGVCDKDGCDFNSYRMGVKNFLGPGLTVDTNLPITVVTQFITNNNSSSGTLTEIRRIYVQNGKVIQNSNTNVPGITPPVNSVADAFCNAQKAAVGDTNSFESRGGLATMGAAIQKGMVLAMSLWDDDEADMLWLDSNYPLNASVTAPGVARGPCSATSGDPSLALCPEYFLT